MRQPQKTTLAGRMALGWAVYTERRVLIVLALGFSAGLPLGLTGSTLNLWMADEGVDLETIGLFSLVGLPYVLKFLWAPLIDALPVPLLTARFGRRRGWLLTTQVALLTAIVLMGWVNPVATPWLMATAALWVAFCSATQDIVIDAFRVESLDEAQYAAGMANYVAAYRLALLTSGAGAIGLAAYLQSHASPGGAVWSLVYATMALLVLVGMAAVLVAKEPPSSKPFQSPGTLEGRVLMKRALIDPFTDFSKKTGWAVILAFVVLFKFGDAFAGTLMAPFALDLGFSMTDYAYIANFVGLPAALAGGFIGGWLGRVIAMGPALWFAGFVQMVSNLAFLWLALAGSDLFILGWAIAIESLTGGIGTVIFVAYLSSLCQTPAFTATQFALLTAFAATGRTILSASAGFVATAVGWPLFFIVTTLAALPALALLAWLHARTRLGAPENLSAASARSA